MSIDSTQFIAVPQVPLIWPGDNLAEIMVQCLAREGLSFEDGDVLALAQKIVSKSEGRLVNLSTINPSEQALALASQVGKDPRHVEVILRESKEVIWASPGIFVVETHYGLVCANAGVDRSNIEQVMYPPPQEVTSNGKSTSDSAEDFTPTSSQVNSSKSEWLCLLPRDPDASAAQIRQLLKELTGAEVAVLINDTHGRPFRVGGIGVAIGSAGLMALLDQRGEQDIFGYTLQSTVLGFGDELASAASLIMGQAAEATPAVLIRGLRYRRPDPTRPDPGATELIRAKEKDVFRYPAKRKLK
ncbi:MAG: coenzyme F420-0:L-glutamate ligase [Chloroflexota bacterium]